MLWHLTSCSLSIYIYIYITNDIWIGSLHKSIIARQHGQFQIRTFKLKTLAYIHNILFTTARECTNHKRVYEELRRELILTNHSLWPWSPSWLSLFTAIIMPVPGLVAVIECSSIHPLKTEPNPPSPTTLSGRKFLVAIFSSVKAKLFKLVACKISPSLLGVIGIEAE